MLLLLGQGVHADGIEYSNPLKIEATRHPLPGNSRATTGTASRSFLADPDILRHQGRYYLYGTSNDSCTKLFEPEAGLGIRCFSSDNLIDWKDEGLALNARDHENVRFAREMFWSPQVIQADGWFYLFFNAADEEFARQRAERIFCSSSPYQRLCVARARKPTGPFAEWAAPLMDDDEIPGWVDGEKGVIGAIDPHVFVEDATATQPQRIFIFWSGIDDENNRNLLWGAELKDDFTGLKLPPEGAKPRIILGEPLQDWELRACGERRIIEAPSILQRDGTYFLVYSANSFNLPSYAMGYATATHPLGPYRRADENPILASQFFGREDQLTYPLDEQTVIGSGSGSFVAGPGGKDYLVYGAIEARTTESLCSNFVGGARKIYLDPVHFTLDGKLKIDGPTRGKPRRIAPGDRNSR